MSSMATSGVGGTPGGSGGSGRRRGQRSRARGRRRGGGSSANSGGGGGPAQPRSGGGKSGRSTPSAAASGGGRRSRRGAQPAAERRGESTSVKGNAWFDRAGTTTSPPVPKEAVPEAPSPPPASDRSAASGGSRSERSDHSGKKRGSRENGSSKPAHRDDASKDKPRGTRSESGHQAASTQSPPTASRAPAATPDAAPTETAAGKTATESADADKVPPPPAAVPVSSSQVSDASSGAPAAGAEHRLESRGEHSTGDRPDGVSPRLDAAPWYGGGYYGGRPDGVSAHAPPFVRSGYSAPYGMPGAGYDAHPRGAGPTQGFVPDRPGGPRRRPIHGGVAGIAAAVAEMSTELLDAHVVGTSTAANPTPSALKLGPAEQEAFKRKQLEEMHELLERGPRNGNGGLATSGRLDGADDGFAPPGAGGPADDTDGFAGSKKRFKTKLCHHWVQSGGYCPRGSHCDFAHGVHELRMWQEPRNRKFKTKLCSNWLESGGLYCPHADQCHFAHGVGELRVDAAPPARRYKVRLCHNWIESNGTHCPHGDRCSFAHGPEELRRWSEEDGASSGDHRGYGGGSTTSRSFKSKMCVNWVQSGGKFCPRGASCHFAHGVLELREPGSDSGAPTQAASAPAGYAHRREDATYDSRSPGAVEEDSTGRPSQGSGAQANPALEQIRVAIAGGGSGDADAPATDGSDVVATGSDSKDAAGVASSAGAATTSNGASAGPHQGHPSAYYGPRGPAPPGIGSASLASPIMTPSYSTAPAGHGAMHGGAAHAGHAYGAPESHHQMSATAPPHGGRGGYTIPGARSAGMRMPHPRGDSSGTFSPITVPQAFGTGAGMGGPRPDAMPFTPRGAVYSGDAGRLSYLDVPDPGHHGPPMGGMAPFGNAAGFNFGGGAASASGFGSYPAASSAGNAQPVSTAGSAAYTPAVGDGAFMSAAYGGSTTWAPPASSSDSAMKPATDREHDDGDDAFDLAFAMSNNVLN